MERNKIFHSKRIWIVLLVFILVQFLCFLFQIYKEGTETSQILDCKKNIMEQYETENIEKIQKKLEETMMQLENGVEEKDYYGFSYEVYYKAVSGLLEQISYINEYPAYIEGVLEQADSMNTISIFADTDSFSNANLSKTKKDYTDLQGVQPVLFWSEYITKYLNFMPMHGLALLAGIIMVFVLLDERKPGLRSMIFATANGRGKLVVSKILALFLGAGVIAVLFYGTGLLESSLLYSGDFLSDIAYSIQSVQEFKDFTWNISIGEFCVIYLLYRWLVLFMLMLIVWTMLFVIDNPIPAFGIMGVTGVVEYLLVKMIGTNSPAQWFRYMNLWYLYMDKSVFTEYKNFSFFRHPLGKNYVLGITCLLILGLFCMIAYLAGVKKYPCSSKAGSWNLWMNRIQEKIERLSGRYTEKKTITGMEIHKIIFLQKGWLVLVLLCLLFLEQRDFTKINRTAQQEMYYNFMEKNEGIPDKNAQEEIDKLEQTLSKITQEYEQAEKDYEAEKIDLYTLVEYTNKYMAFEQDRGFLEQVKSQTAYLKQLKQEKNIDGWYVNQYSYIHLLDNGNKGMIEDVLFFMGVVLLCSGVFAFEKNCGTKEIVKGTINGRKKLFVRKMMVITILTSLLFLFRTILELLCVWQVYGLSGFEAPIQSINCLSFVGISCSIGTFFVYLYLIKLLVMLAVVCFVCMFSARWPQKVTIGLSVLACIPSVLYLAGLSICKYFSVFTMLNINQYLLQLKNVGITVMMCFIFIAIGTGSLHRVYKIWCCTGK